LIDRLIAERVDANAVRRWAKAEATAAASEPPERTCIECGAEFIRLYRDVNGKPRLRSPHEWTRSIYCSRSCASAYRRRKRVWLAPHLAALEPATPALVRGAGNCLPGRPSRKTGPAAILAAERRKRVMEARFAGKTFKQIGDLEGVSAQAIFKTYWRALDRSAPCRSR
jgi:hypothetical protein